MAAAFFDVDKTVIARSCMGALAPALNRQGMLPRRTLLRGLWTQLLFARFGAGAKKLARLQRTVLAVTEGWEQEAVRAVVAAEMDRTLLPLAFTAALDAIARHQAAGDRVWLVSAAPEEIVAPLARRLGVEAVASQPEVVDGRYTGRMGRYVYAGVKAEAIVEAASRHGIDLEGAWAYSDSVTDLPMLRAVGHPVVINPDRHLRRAAAAEGWPVRRWDRMGPPDATPVSRRSGRRRRTALVVGAATLTTLGWRRRRRGAQRGAAWLRLATSN